MVSKHACLVATLVHGISVTYLHILCQPVKRNVTTACDLENLVRGAHLCLLRAHAGLVPPSSVTSNASPSAARGRRLAAKADFEASWRKWLAWRAERDDLGTAPQATSSHVSKARLMR